MDLKTRTEAAYDLLPEVLTRPTKPSWAQRLATLAVGLLSLLLVAAAVAGVGYHRWWEAQMGARTDAPVTRVAMTDATTWKQAAAAAKATPGLGAEPIVLSYHDIDAGSSRSKYVVSASHFAEQMKMLKLAGYHTLTQAQFVSYLRGDYTPAPRSAVITFDDGTRGLYTHADSILKQYGFHGISFLISGVVGTKAPYYLTWAQVKWMQHSGRWSFAGHTHDTHAQQTDASGRTVHSALTSPIETASGTPETFAEFKKRITRDQDLAFQDFAEHGLPKPTLFAWPFSEVQPEGPNTRTATWVRNLMNSRYAATLVNSAAPTAADKTRSLTLPLQRLEVLDTTSADSLFDQMEQMQSVALTKARPAASDTWVQPWDSVLVPMAASSTGLHPQGPTVASLPVDWQPQQTSSWTGYRVSAVLTGLENGRAGLRARVGSQDQVTVSATANSVRVERIDRLTVDPEPVGRDYDISTRGSLRVSVEVRADSTVVTFGGHRVVLPVTHTEDTTGGIGLYFGAASGGHVWPHVRDLEVAPL